MSKIGKLVGCSHEKVRGILNQHQKKTGKLNIQKKIAGPDHLNVAKAYDNIAITYKYLSDYDKALEWSQKAMTIFEKLLDENHPALATYYHNLAVIYQELRVNEMALVYESKA